MIRSRVGRASAGRASVTGDGRFERLAEESMVDSPNQVIFDEVLKSEVDNRVLAFYPAGPRRPVRPDLRSISWVLLPMRKFIEITQ